MVFGLLGLNVGVVSVTLYLAHSDPSFAVEPDYDRRAMAWDESQRLAAASDALGWTAALDVRPPDAAGARTLTLRLTDQAAAPVAGATVGLEAFASLRAGERRQITLSETGPGVYQGGLEAGAAGQWTFRVRAVREADRFETSLEAMVAPAGEGGP
jgi:nitrogen fixation protein FixH